MAILWKPVSSVSVMARNSRRVWRAPANILIDFRLQTLALQDTDKNFISRHGDSQRRTPALTVTPEAATKLQIELYRSMTGEQRLKIALDLHELSCELAREGIRRQHPDAGEAEVERLLRQRLALARRA
jgi:hypothetical protein